MADLVRELIVKPGSPRRLADIDPDSTASFKSKQQAQQKLADNIRRLADLQYRLYAENRRAVLIVFQAMDAGGKDGAIRRVMTGLNPQGCRVTAFKVPAGEELRHDFLWRIHRAVPPFGEIGIFNRSQYEDVLVARVHSLVPKSVWTKRYGQINAFEEMLAENGITIIKFFLHISKQEQLKRFEERKSDPLKSWKISPADYSERQHWDDYLAAYEDAINKCSKPWAPWFVIPANRKWFRNVAVSEILVDTMQRMDLKLPQPSIELDKLPVA